MDIRTCRETDGAACLAVFDSNLDGARRDDFVLYLRSPLKVHFVAEHDGQIVACGGYEVRGPDARLRWGTVRRDLQRQGLGRYPPTVTSKKSAPWKARPQPGAAPLLTAIFVFEFLHALEVAGGVLLDDGQATRSST